MKLQCDNCGRTVDKLSPQGLCPKCVREEEERQNRENNSKKRLSNDTNTKHTL